MLRKKCALLCVGLLVTVCLGLAGCGGTPAVGAITVTPSASTVDGADTATLAATVANDRNSAGVSWNTSAGTLSSTTTTSATFTAPAATSSAQSITITATSIADTTKTGTTTITVPAKPSITTTSTNLTGAVGSAYSVTLAGSGGISPYTWALTSGTLPTCLTMTTGGVIAGTLTASCAGTYDLTFTMTDSGSPTKLTATTSLTMTITAPTLTFPTSLASGTVGTAYSASVAASGVLGTTTYSLASGSLPTSGDLALNTSTGAIAGTPKHGDEGAYTFAVKVVDAYGDTATSGTLSITISAATAIAFGSAPTGTATFGVTYSSAVTATGGAGTLTYTKASGALPPNLTLASNGAITGTPKAADIGAWTFAVTAADAYLDSTTSGDYTITVSYPAVSVTQITPPTGYEGSTYTSTTLTATGGNGGSYTWSCVPSGCAALPSGLSLSSGGEISGKPATGSAGTYSVTVQATDSASNSGAATLSITIKAGITIDSITLPTGYAGSSYPPTGGSSTMSATGGTGTYTWSLAAASGSSVPSGLSINSSSGLISGTLATGSAGTYSVVVTATDTASNTASVTLPITIGAGVSVTDLTLANAYPATAYTSSAFTASGGSGTGYAWSLAAASGSSVPSGFAIGSSSGILAATSPVNSGTSNLSYSLVVTATDSLGNTGSRTVTLTIEAPIAITPTTLPSGTVEVEYSTQLAASGGSGSFSTWQVTTGASALSASPYNLSLSTSGLLTGTPTSAAAGQTVSFTVQVTDSESHTATAGYSITFYNGLAITTTSMAAGNVGSSYSQTLNAGGGSGSGYKWTTTSSDLSSYGLNLSETGVVSGTPTAPGTASFTAKVTDSSSNSTTQSLTITIYSALSLPTPNPDSLPSGYTGVSYTGSVSGSGGSGDLTAAVSTALSPANNTLAAVASGSTVNVTGTATTAATESFGVTLTDNTTKNSITQTGYTIAFTAPTAPSLPSASSTVPGSATVNESYTSSIAASGGVGSTYTWTLNSSTTVPTSGAVALGSDTLGSEFTISNSGGGSSVSITGKPTTTGTVSFTLAVKDDATSLTSSTVTYAITVSSLAVTVDEIPQGMVGMPYTFGNFEISGGTSPYTVTYSNLPDGLAQSTSNTYQIVGTPTSSAVGTTTVTLKVTDYASATVQTTFKLPVAATTTAANNSYLKGQYACYYQQYWDDGVAVSTSDTFYRGGAVLAFTASGGGAITGGEMDSSSPSKGYKSATTNGALSGTYVVGSDNRGYLNLVVNSNTQLFALAGGKLDSSSNFSEFAIVGMDDAGSSPSGKTGSGHCYKQDTSTALSSLTVSGGYVFGWRGEDSGGSLESFAGYFNFSSGNVTGTIDMVDDGTYTADVAITGTYTTTLDSYGRTTMAVGPSGEQGDFVMYYTNNTAGEAVLMSAESHTSSTSGDFLLGEARKSNISTSYPLNGNAVLYTSGPDSSLTTYKAQVSQATATGSSSSTTFVINANISNDGGTLNTTDKMAGKTLTYTTNSTTGRTTIAQSGTTIAGDVFYVYDTNSAVVLFADGSSSTVQNQLGWLEPQTAPSGTWAASDLSASYFMSDVINGDYSNGAGSGVLTVGSSGSMSNFAQDQGGQQWADWDEGLSGDSSTTATGVVDPDSTYGSYGVFDVKVTPDGGTESTQVYCVAVSVDAAANSSTKGRLVCVDASNSSPKLTILEE